MPMMQHMRVFFVLIQVICGSCLASSVLNAEENRVVRVGTFNLHPLNFIDAQGQAHGLYPDLIRATADHYRWDVEFIPGDWPTCLERLQSGDIDLMTTIAYSEERVRTMDFSTTAVCDIWGQVFTLPGDHIAGVRDLAGQSVGIMTRDINGRNFKNLIQRLGIECDLRQYPSHDAIFAAIQQK